MQHQFLRLLTRGLAVVARYGQVHVGREQSSLRGIHAFHHRMRHLCGVCPLALGDSDGDRWLRCAARSRVRHVGRRLAEFGCYVCDVAHVHWGTAAHSDYHAPDLGWRFEGCTHLDAIYLICRRELAGLQPRVGPFERRGHLTRCHAARRQPRRVERHTNLLGLATHHERVCDVGHCADLVLHVPGNLPQHVRVVSCGV